MKNLAALVITGLAVVPLDAQGGRRSPQRLRRS